MAREYFVTPNVVELPLFPDEDSGIYITVKERLTFIEEEKLKSASLTSLNFNASREEGESEIGLDMAKHAILRLAVWITDWNLPDHKGKALEVTRANIESLHPDVAAEINRVLDEHVKAMEKNASSRIVALPPVTES